MFSDMFWWKLSRKEFLNKNVQLQFTRIFDSGSKYKELSVGSTGHYLSETNHYEQ